MSRVIACLAVVAALGVAVVTPKSHTQTEVVAIMTGAQDPGAAAYTREVEHPATH